MAWQKLFPNDDPLWVEPPVTGGIPYKMVNNQRQGFGVFYCWQPEQIMEKTTELLMIWDAHVTLL